MSFLNILAGICIVFVIGLGVASVIYDFDNEIVTIYSPVGFLFCIHYTCRYLSEKPKRPNEKKPWNVITKCFDYFFLVLFILQICGYLMSIGLAADVMLLIPAVTYSFAVAAIFFYIEEKRKGVPLEKGEEQSSDIHG